METKLLEIVDRMTYIPVLATRMLPTDSPNSPHGIAEYYALRRAGYAFGTPSVMICRLTANGTADSASYDPHRWHNARTMTTAHKWIAKNWDKLLPGDVVDVEFIIGETAKPKRPERETDPLSGLTR